MTAPHDSEVPSRRLPAENEIEIAILALAAKEGPGKTISPTDAAISLAPGEEWQKVLPLVRRVAVRLALAGRLIIYRKGKPVDPTEFRGVYRLGLPNDS